MALFPFLPCFLFDLSHFSCYLIFFRFRFRFLLFFLSFPIDLSLSNVCVVVYTTFNMYVVQAGSGSTPNFSPPRVPLAISSQRVNIWYHSDPHDQWKRVTWPVFLYRPRAVSRSEPRIDQRQAFNTFNNTFRLFPAGAKKTFATHFARSSWTYSKACL